MKRLWLGLALAVILLALGLGTSRLISRSADAIAEILDTAAETALTGDLQTAASLAEDAHRKWENAWHKIASIADHAPMDEIDSLFAQLSVYAATDHTGEFAAHCKSISKLVLAVGEAHALSWWNLL